MAPLHYHAGQLAIQREANSTRVAEHLSHWEGPVAQFSLDADLILLATPRPDGPLHFTVLSGPSPLVEITGRSTLRLLFPPGTAPAGGTACGGLAINLGLARRARINGRLVGGAGETELEPTELFTLCRKYMAPSVTLGDAAHAGPIRTEPIDLDDPWVADVIARAETTFLASISPEGGPDVAHRGGPPGFIEFDPVEHRLAWPEFIGDGVFKSAGNVRATGELTLLVLDLDTGDGVELIGRGEYTNILVDRKQRVEPLLQHRDPYPVQGRMVCDLREARRLTAVTHPRSKIPKALKITSRSTPWEQAPQ